MNQVISKFLKYSILSALLLIVLAVLFIVQSAMTIIVIAYVIGALLVALGVQAELEFVKNLSKAKLDLNLIYGIVCVILGVIVISYPESIEELVSLVIGFIMVVSSAIKIQYCIELKKQADKKWLVTLLLSIVMTICGVVLIVNPFQGLELFLRIVGGFILGYAVIDLVTNILLMINSKKAKKEAKIKEADIIEEEKPKDNKKIGDQDV